MTKHTENKTIEAEIKLFTKKCLKDIRITRSGLTSKQTEIVLGFFYQHLRESLERVLKERTESMIEDFKNRDFEACKLHTISKYDPSIECKNCLANLKSKYLKQEEKGK